jgi:hypothetical protein
MRSNLTVHRSLSWVGLVALALAAASAGCKKAREWKGKAEVISGSERGVIAGPGPCGPDNVGFTLWAAGSAEDGYIRIAKHATSGQYVTVQPPEKLSKESTVVMKDNCTTYDVAVEDQGTKDSDGKPEFKGRVKLDCKVGPRQIVTDITFEDCR